MDWLNPPKPVLCVHCKKPRGKHKAVTLQCPKGRGRFPVFLETRFTPRERKKMANKRLTKPLLDAMANALNVALAGAGWDGGDFDGQNPEHFERALEWVEQQRSKKVLTSKSKNSK